MARWQDRQYDFFLTHDWGTDELGRSNHERVSRVNQMLQALQYRPWFDEERMRGDVNHHMANGIKESSAVVVFITERYIEKASGNGPNGANDNCKVWPRWRGRRSVGPCPRHGCLITPPPGTLTPLNSLTRQFEFDSALFSKHLGVEKMISVVMEPRCCSTVEWPDGTVKGKLAGKLYINLTDDDDAKFNEGVSRLVDEIATVIGKEPVRGSGGAIGSAAGERASETRPLASLNADEVALLMHALELGRYADAVRSFPLRESIAETAETRGSARRPPTRRLSPTAPLPHACRAPPPTATPRPGCHRRRRPRGGE